MSIKISISKHGRERINERILDRVIEDYLLKVFNNGKKLNDQEYKQFFDKAQQYKGFFSTEFRKYDGYVYVFGGKSEDKNDVLYRFITVFPLRTK